MPQNEKNSPLVRTGGAFYFRPQMAETLAFNNVTFAWGASDAPLFANFTAQFPAGWTGVAGANGAGKTTFLKVATGELAPTAGSVVRGGSGGGAGAGASGESGGTGGALYVAQRTDEPPEHWDAFFWAPDAAALKSRLRIGDDWDEPARWLTLSHGERKRAQIAVALWLAPALLALDEPTNHIDADARALLVAALREFRGTGLLVSHDRELLDSLCGRTLVIDPPDATLRAGGVTAALAAQSGEEEAVRREDDILRHAAERLREEGHRRRVIGEQKGAAMRAAKKGKKVVHDHDGRAKRNLALLTNKDAWAGKQAAQLGRRAGKIEKQRATLTIKKHYETGIWVDDASRLPRDFLLRLPAGEIALTGNGNGSDGDTSIPRRILRHPALAIAGADRIALTGANGLGKSTLIRRVLDALAPALPAERLVYVPQEITAGESREILAAVKELDETERGRVMTTVSRLGSRPARLLESAQPSPGEVRKILLALGIVRGPHLIVMDEPTNHLDLPGILCLEDALADCPCALLLASHDRPFLEKLTTTEWHIAPGTGNSATGNSATGNSVLTISH
jgi:ATPase subunit of ABC transporter with duplicated ATPase domains